jgi:hypothetical protein
LLLLLSLSLVLNFSPRYRTHLAVVESVVESVWPSLNLLAIFGADCHSVGVLLSFWDVISSWQQG